MEEREGSGERKKGKKKIERVWRMENGERCPGGKKKLRAEREEIEILKF
jgi:hypothetical protein